MERDKMYLFFCLYSMGADGVLFLQLLLRVWWVQKLINLSLPIEGEESFLNVALLEQLLAQLLPSKHAITACQQLWVILNAFCLGTRHKKHKNGHKLLSYRRLTKFPQVYKFAVKMYQLPLSAEVKMEEIDQDLFIVMSNQQKNHWWWCGWFISKSASTLIS